MTIGDELASPNSAFLTLEGLKTVDVPMKAWVVALISEVLFERDWCHTSCLKCKKKVNQRNEKLFCDNCNDYVVGNTRYKVHVNVVDGTGASTFLLWDESAKVQLEWSLLL